MRTRIKICGLTREGDVDAAVEAGADAVGFVRYSRSSRYVSVARAAELARRLPPLVTPVLLFVNAEPADVIAASSAVPGALLQFHGDETPADCWAASGQGARRFVRAARVPLDPVEAAAFDWDGFVADYGRADGILLDAKIDGYGGGGHPFDWSILPERIDTHVILGGGLTAENVGSGIAALRERCRTLTVDVSSGVEESKGIKDPAKIRAFIDAVRAVDERATA